MERLGSLAELFIEDVNQENSMVVELFGNIVNFLFKAVLVSGIPFLAYVLFEFAGVF
jgi:hypothetical protein